MTASSTNGTKQPWFVRMMEKAHNEGRTRLIPTRDGEENYLERLALHPRWLTLGLFRVNLHRFWKSDDPLDGLHDHPWPFITIILKGGYIEHLTRGRSKVYTKGSIGFSRAKKLHRVELIDEGEYTYTLFIMGPRRRTWGFVVDGVWWNYKDWLNKRGTNNV